MPNPTIYLYKKWSSCVKASKFLRDRDIKFNEVDILETQPKKKDLQIMLDSYEGNIKKLFNTSGVAYRELKISEKIDSMSKTEAFKLLSTNGKLVKRPFMISKNKGIVGFKEDNWKEFLS